jgi:hypothetical protein
MHPKLAPPAAAPMSEVGEIAGSAMSAPHLGILALRLSRILIVAATRPERYACRFGSSGGAGARLTRHPSTMWLSASRD